MRPPGRFGIALRACPVAIEAPGSTLQVSFQEVDYWDDIICLELARSKGLPAATPRDAKQSLGDVSMHLYVRRKEQLARLLDFRVFLLDYDLVLDWIALRR